MQENTLRSDKPEGMSGNESKNALNYSLNISHNNNLKAQIAESTNNRFLSPSSSNIVKKNKNNSSSKKIKLGYFSPNTFNASYSINSPKSKLVSNARLFNSPQD